MTKKVKSNRIAYPVKFRLGQIVATPSIIEACTSAYRLQCLARHSQGDWGNSSDKAANDRALLNGSRIISAYPIDPSKPCKGYGSNCLWIITEADRSATTLLLPDEY